MDLRGLLGSIVLMAPKEFALREIVQCNVNTSQGKRTFIFMFPFESLISELNTMLEFIYIMCLVVSVLGFFS